MVNQEVSQDIIKILKCKKCGGEVHVIAAALNRTIHVVATAGCIKCNNWWDIYNLSSLEEGELS